MVLVNLLCKFGGMRMPSAGGEPATPSQVSQIVQSPLGESCHDSYMLVYWPLE